MTEVIRAIEDPDNFTKFYSEILKTLDDLHRGVFNEGNSDRIAAACLLAQVGLSKALSEAEHRARSLKRDVEFDKAEVYLRPRPKADGDKKITEAALASIISRDEKVIETQKQQSEAEKEAKNLATILGVLRDAHLLFRALIKKQ